MKKLGFGMMRLPITGTDYSNVDLHTMQEMVDRFIAAGGTYFDTGYPYHQGKSEIAFRETVVKRYPRDKFTITDKMPTFLIKNEEQLESIFNEQLERCGVDYFDYYFLHALGAINYETAQKTHAFEFIAKKKSEGKIGHIGFSFHDSPEVLERILTEHPEIEYVQLQLNYIDWENPAFRIHQSYEIATAHKKPVIVMEPVKGGALASVPQEAEKLFKEAEPEMSVASWAVRFAATHNNVMMVLSGMSNVEQMNDNLSYMLDFKPLNDSEMKIIKRAADIIRSSITIPCTACRYCVDGCPKNIAIPDCFAILNNLKRFKGFQDSLSNTYYTNLVKEHGKASDCIKCGQCEEHCPQHLPIRKYLEDVAKTLE